VKNKSQPNFDRYMTALNCQEPDRVPLGEWEIVQVAKEGFLGRKIENIKDEIEFWLTAGFDYVPVRSGIMDSPRGPQRITGEANRSEFGEKSARKWAMEHEGIIRNWEEFENFHWPSVDDYDLSKWEIYDKNLPPGMKTIFVFGKFFTAVWMYMGTETFYYSLKENEDLVSALFEKVKEFQLGIFERVVEHRCVGAVLNNDDIAHNNGLMIHPQYLKKYVFPSYKKIGEVCRNKGLGYIFHSDGDCTAVMDDIIDCKYHAFNPIQPNAMDISEVKRKWGKKLCLIGNINLDSTLTMGTPEDVETEVYERIRTLAPGGGYMVASSNSIPDYVPPANMKAMFAATWKYGRYPIQLEKGKLKGKVSTYLGKPMGEKPSLDLGPDIERYSALLLEQNVSELKKMIKLELESGLMFPEVISKQLIPAMTLIGLQYQKGEIFIPEMMMSANAMKIIMADFKNQMAYYESKDQGIVVIGTVKGDMHDIGKNLVAMMLEGQGFKVVDLGTSVSPEGFAKAILENKANILGLSALLTTTMLEMQNTIEAVKKAGLREKVRIIIGGAPVTQDFANRIGADGYAYDAPGAAKKCKEWNE
jgi:uroporphyrinogen decarboxylase